MNKILNINSDTSYAEKIFEIEKICFPDDYWSSDSISQSILQRYSLFLVYFVEEKIAGYINVYSIANEAELNRIAVLPEFRKQGIGLKLINCAIENLKENNCLKFFLEVRRANLPAICLYKKIGFLEDSIRKNYYQKPSDDAVLMSLDF